MQRTAPGLRTDPAARLAELERRRPEWQTWLALLSEVDRALADEGWRAPLDNAELATSAVIPADAPLLHGRTLRVDAARVQRLLRRLGSAVAGGDLAGAGSFREYHPTGADAVRLLGAAVRQDPIELGTLAAEASVDRGPLASIAHLAAFPLLQACGRRLAERVPRFWPHGYCPICAAWPILAERRGLDRSRRMRCGRCAGEWEVQWLCCVYCGEREHEQLESLVPEDRGEMLRVETCARCGGYLKSIATLQGIHPFELLLQDLDTIELDLVALDRGYRRPEKSGFSLRVQVIEHASGRDL